MHNSKTTIRALAIAGTMLLAPAARAQTTWYVDSAGCPGPGSGAEGDPFCLIQSGIDSATDGDEVLVAAGAYAETIDFLGKAIEVRSVSGPAATTIDGGGSGPVVTFENGESLDSVLAGFTITGGVAEFGGGMSIASAGPSVIDCIFTGNTATDSSGAIDNFGGSPIITGCMFGGNSAANYGGAISNFEGGAEIADCTFEANEALVGGGISNAFSTVSVTDCAFVENVAGSTSGALDNDTSDVAVEGCSFAGNLAGDFGGAVGNFDSEVTIADSTFSTNGAGDGGAISSEDSTPVVSGCTFDSNTADGFGGGLDNANSVAVVTNSSFLSNSAGEGGAIAGGGPVTNCVFLWNTALADGGALSLEDQTVANCSFYGNTAGDDGGGVFNSTTSAIQNCVLWANVPDQIYETPPANTLVRHSDVQGGWAGDGENNMDAPPLFVDPLGDDLRLLSGSPCIDAGDNGAVPPDSADLDGDGDASEPTPLDLDGNPRIVDGGGDEEAVVDMGPYESQTNVPCPWDFDGDGVVGPFDLAVLLGDWGPNPGHPADLDGDGAVGPFDLALLLGNWGACE